MTTPDLQLMKFIAEPISVYFKEPLLASKRPHCPNGFEWAGKEFLTVNCFAEWKDYTRRGRMARNMQPKHAEAAQEHGSRGVGRFYYEVETEDKCFFRLCYDRAPKDAFDQKGHRFLMAELKQGEDL